MLYLLWNAVTESRQRLAANPPFSGRYLTLVVCVGVFVLVHAVTGDTRHTGDIETRRWCNQLSDSSPHHISFQPDIIPRPNLNTNTGTHHKERVDKLTAEFISNIHGLANMNTLAGFPYYLSITHDRQGFIFQIGGIGLMASSL